MSSTADPPTRPPLVVLPVYGQVETAARALRSIDATTLPEVEVLVIDDGGTPSFHRDLFEAAVTSGRPCRLVRHERNLGFVASVNEAIAQREGRDVVVVNSDVVVFRDWLTGLLSAAEDPRVASATALTNRGSIATVPDLADAASPDQLRTFAEQCLDDPAPSSPLAVAVGHCVLLTDRALTEVGAFDEAFSPGYGEEVDWSIRAARRGWRHVAARRTVVWHDSAGTFGSGRRGLQRRHELRLALRYPREFIALRRMGGPPMTADQHVVEQGAGLDVVGPGADHAAPDWDAFLDHDYEADGPQQVAGECPICGDTTFVVRGAWFRDLWECPTCPGSSIPRERALARVIETYVPRWRELTIHEAAPAARGSSAWLRSGASGYSCSQYDPSKPLGLVEAGIANENLETLTLESESVDLLVHSDVMEHVNRPDLVMKEAARVLRPGGTCVFTTPTFPDLVRTYRRAIYHDDGTVEHLHPAEYHGSEDAGRVVLVTFHYGHDLPELILRWSGLTTDVIRSVDPRAGIMGLHAEVYICRKPLNPVGEPPSPRSRVRARHTGAPR